MYHLGKVVEVVKHILRVKEYIRQKQANYVTRRLTKLCAGTIKNSKNLDFDQVSSTNIKLP